MKVLRSIVQA
ncbi:unnamed protein product [Cuscuta epithymum]|uniref:Uncharacterized protein n=1 Tax=Cuscuta epithymum TaxID=186058 RepID=A0AAV0EX80_9ASTE|nr:unnamed protein product [Cuscuta epithymum]